MVKQKTKIKDQNGGEWGPVGRGETLNTNVWTVAVAGFSRGERTVFRISQVRWSLSRWERVVKKHTCVAVSPSPVCLTPQTKGNNTCPHPHGESMIQHHMSVFPEPGYVQKKHPTTNPSISLGDISLSRRSCKLNPVIALRRQRVRSRNVRHPFVHMITY